MNTFGPPTQVIVVKSFSFLLLERTKTQCETHRDSLLGESGPRGPRPPVGQFIPRCDDNGAYEPMQCHGSTGHCWCVDRNGQEIPGTRSGPGSRPMCEFITDRRHRMWIYSPGHPWFLRCLSLVGIDHEVVPPPVGPTPRPDVHPLPPGTHLLFAQSGRIEHVPLEGYDMKKDDAKTVLHLPVSVS